MPYAYIRQHIAILNVTYCDDLLHFSNLGKCEHNLYNKFNKIV